MNYEGLRQHLAGIEWDVLMGRSDRGQQDTEEGHQDSGRANYQSNWGFKSWSA